MKATSRARPAARKGAQLGTRAAQGGRGRHGARARDGAAAVDALATDTALARGHRVWSVRADLLYRLGRHDTVTFTLSLEPTGLMRLISRMSVKSMRSEVSQLPNLKADLEKAT
jgi:hypothetical protein